MIPLLSYCAVQNKYLLEISVESVDAAMAAERGGANRIELCSSLREGGTTPSLELMRGVRGRVGLPIYSMIRPRGGNFYYTDSEFAAMRRDVDAAKEFGTDGVVLGLLRADGLVDIVRTRELVEQATPLHRAFDECADLRGALEDVMESGAARLLTSGGKRTAPEALEVLGELVRMAGERLIVMLGSGLHAGNIREVVRKTGAREFHAGLSSVVADPGADIGKFEAEVRRMEEVLRDRV